MSRYFSRIDTGIWRNHRFQGLSDDGKVLFLYLIACPHGNAIGMFDLPLGYVCADLGWPSERVSEGLSEALSEGLIERCEKTGLTRITGWWERNSIENPNVAKSVRALLDRMPKRSPVFLSFVNDLVASPPRFLEALAKDLSKGLPKDLPKPLRNTDDREQITEDREQTTETHTPTVVSGGLGGTLAPGQPIEVQPEPKRKAKRAIPPGWLPDTELQTWAKATTPGANIITETEKLREWAGANAITKADWRLTWMSWMRKAQEQHEQKMTRLNGGHYGSGPNPKPANPTMAPSLKNRRQV